MMIVWSPHDFCILILGQKSYCGRRETARVQLEVIGTPYRDMARSVRSSLKVCGDHTITVRSQCDFV